jgi:hypothetical protein
VLDIAAEVFDQEIYKNGIFIDFDPYFVMALSINKKNFHLWEEAETYDKGLKALVAKVPDFFLKVQRIKKIFQKRYKRKLGFKICDLGAHIYWADIGQHYAMRQKYMSLNEQTSRGEITRKLENITEQRDTRGNIIINSRIDADIRVQDSIIINSTLTGSGTIEKSVVKDSRLHNPVLNQAFSVLSIRPVGTTHLHEQSGLYRSIGDKDLELGPGMRHGTLITESRVFDMEVSEKTNLRDRDNTYKIPVFNNKISFAEAYDEMFGISEKKLDEYRQRLIKAVSEEKG